MHVVKKDIFTKTMCAEDYKNAQCRKNEEKHCLPAVQPGGSRRRKEEEKRAEAQEKKRQLVRSVHVQPDKRAGWEPDRIKIASR